MNETVYDIWLSAAISPGGVYDGLFTELKSAREVYEASAGGAALTGDCFSDGQTPVFESITPRLRTALRNHDLGDAERVAEYCARNDVKILVRGQNGYPQILEKLQKPPYLLYVIGELPDMDRELGIGIVGTRKMSSYGMENAYRISYELASAGVVTVSGMARGIDGAAAAGTLEAGGRTIAVIGCGIDKIFPSEHASLMKEIASNGAVISEYLPGSEPVSAHFPIRNRIVCGLSRGVLVVEADLKSGAMLTAKIAQNENKDLFALPGRWGDTLSAGPNDLLKHGAHPCFGADDILAVYLSEGDTAVSSCNENTAKKEKFALNIDAYARSVSYSGFYPRALTKRGVWLSRDTGGADVVAFKEERSKASDLPEDSKMRAFYEKMPKGKPVSPDYFVTVGYRADEAVSLLSLLEITGFVKSIPGGMFIR